MTFGMLFSIVLRLKSFCVTTLLDSACFKRTPPLTCAHGPFWTTFGGVNTPGVCNMMRSTPVGHRIPVFGCRISIFGYLFGGVRPQNSTKWLKTVNKYRPMRTGSPQGPCASAPLVPYPRVLLPTSAGRALSSVDSMAELLIISRGGVAPTVIPIVGAAPCIEVGGGSIVGRAVLHLQFSQTVAACLKPYCCSSSKTERRKNIHGSGDRRMPTTSQQRDTRKPKGATP